MILLLINAFSEICRKIQNRKGIDRYENCSVCWGKEYEYSKNYGQSAKTGMDQVAVISEIGAIQEKLGLCNNTTGKTACR